MEAYQFKITLKRFRPPIWRRIVIPACMSFETFSDILQELFGFDGSHLAEFNFPGMDFSMQKYRNPDSWHRILVMGRHPLEEFQTAKKFTYTYDFGDDWEFEIVREKFLEDYPNNYPILLKYKGNNLVEDCGGVYGYAELLRAWEHPAEADQELLEWAGEKEQYDFDPDKIRESLKKYTCDENGEFLLREGLDEEDDEDDYDEEEAYFQEIRNALKEEILRNDAAKNPDGAASLLLNMINDPESMEKLINLERLPKNMGEHHLVVSYAVADTFVHAARSVNRVYGIPAAEVVDAFNLEPQEKNTVLMMLEDIEAEEELPF